MFIKYQHLEKYGNTEVEGIEIGTCHVFPKLDGTNGQLWMEDGKLMAGSRNRVLSLDNDNAGFYNAMINDENIRKFFMSNPNLTLYGEWLVPHTLKTYEDSAWRKFYVFDVFNRETNKLLHYAEYTKLLDEHILRYLPPIALIFNGGHEYFIECLKKNVFLIKDGMGVGEGIVIKNYAYENRFGRQTWAKIITNEFKENHHKEMGAPEIGGEVVEQKIVEKCVTQHLVDKTVAKITLEKDGWSSKYIPMLLSMVYYDLVHEELWDQLKEHKQPTINFRTLNTYTIHKVKELAKDIF
jgi:hypothetical protein